MPEEYAPQYSEKQKRLLVFVMVTLSALLILGVQTLLFPQLMAFASVAHCYEILGVEGPRLLLYGIFTGLPLLLALTLGAWFSWRGLRIVRHRQTPLPGEKVFQTRPIVFGDRAVRLGWLHHLPMVLLLAFALWGAFQAEGILAASNAFAADYRLCAS
ncbi:MAG: hypothetical protein R3296_04265 [Oleiphilaceae bacterium]|nr:hypothetical protein [Oleiphilaceae bacterium]